MELDPFEARLEFLTLLGKLNASQHSIQKVGNFAMRNRNLHEDLYSCIIEEMNQATSLNVRMNIFYVLDSICQQSKKATFAGYLDLIRKNMVKIIETVTPTGPKGNVNVAGTKKVLEGWRTKAIFPANVIEQVEQPLCARESSTNIPTVAETGFTRDDILRRMDEDRERHKRIREEIWIRPQDEDPGREFEEAWEDESDLDAQDFADIEIENQKYLPGYDWEAELSSAPDDEVDRAMSVDIVVATTLPKNGHASSSSNPPTPTAPASHSQHGNNGHDHGAHGHQQQQHLYQQQHQYQPQSHYSSNNYYSSRSSGGTSSSHNGHPSGGNSTNSHSHGALYSNHHSGTSNSSSNNSHYYNRQDHPPPVPPPPPIPPTAQPPAPSIARQASDHQQSSQLYVKYPSSNNHVDFGHHHHQSNSTNSSNNNNINRDSSSDGSRSTNSDYRQATPPLPGNTSISSSNGLGSLMSPLSSGPAGMETLTLTSPTFMSASSASLFAERRISPHHNVATSSSSSSASPSSSAAAMASTGSTSLASKVGNSGSGSSRLSPGRHHPYSLQHHHVK